MTVQYVIDGAVGVPEEELAVHIGDTLFVIDRARYVLALRTLVSASPTNVRNWPKRSTKTGAISTLPILPRRKVASKAARVEASLDLAKGTVVEHQSGGSAELYPTLAAGAVAA
jgi:multidrug resistance efflux pump